jgi:uncharacterized BrkB/YihY/UPF0761 family membrane protein
MEDLKLNDKQLEILLYIGILIVGVLGVLMCTGVFGEQVQQAFNEYVIRFTLFRSFP